MTWLTNTLGTSVGKKLMMAITGLSFCGFLAVHLIGNLTLYGGSDFFTAYVKHLHAYGPIITVAELGLVALAIVHVLTGLTLFIGNLNARPIRYAVKKNAGGRTVGSSTMPYTGILLLAFLIFHLLDIRFPTPEPDTVYQLVFNSFAKKGYIFIYIIGVFIAAVHVSHGLWSAFQTLGANHPKYMPFIQGLGIAFSVIVAIGFGFIPVYISTL